MPQENSPAVQKEEPPTPLETELGNAPGVGLTLEQIRSVVSKAHDVMLPKDDATLMIATILNAYLTEMDKLQARHVGVDPTDGRKNGRVCFRRTGGGKSAFRKPFLCFG